MNMLESIIGLVVYFLLTSLVATGIVEMIATRRRLRGKVLRQAVQACVGGKQKFVEELYKQPLIRSLYQEPGGSEMEGGHPSYIPPGSFSRAFLECVIGRSLNEAGDLGCLFAPDQKAAVTKDRAWAAEAYDVVRAHVLAAKGDPSATLALIEESFAKANERAVGWYKARISKYLLGVGFGLAIVTNGDTSRVFSRLNANPALRSTLLELAEGGHLKLPVESLALPGQRAMPLPAPVPKPTETPVVTSPPPYAAGTSSNSAQVVIHPELVQANPVSTPAGATVSQTAPRLDTSDGAVSSNLLARVELIEQISGGWTGDAVVLTFNPCEGKWWLLATMKLFGFLVTAMAVSLGAPFWFQALQKLLQIRGSLKVLSGKEREPADAAAATSPRDERQITLALSALNTGMPEEILQPSHGRLALAAEMAGFASLAYESEASISQSLLLPAHNGAELLAFISKRSELDELLAGQKLTIPIDTQVCVIRTPSRLVVAFRGTEPPVWQDILTDAAVWMRPVKWSPAAEATAHHGFLMALDAVWTDLISALAQANAANATQLPIHFCGHSLGGALAVLAAARFLGDHATAESQRLEISRVFGGVHTIGQPRVGNSAFAKWAEMLFGHRYTRAVHHRDIVARLPPSVPDKLEYAHFGILHYLDSRNQLWVNPGWAVRLLDVASTDEDLKQLLRDAVAHHSADAYVQCYGKILEDAKPKAAAPPAPA